MPLFVRSGGQWVESVPKVRNGSTWTDEDDQLFVRDGGEWKLIYPDPADAGDLLPVEGLAVTAGPDHQSVTIGWTNPAQPTVTPTAVQIRLAELGAVWTEVDYPVTSWSWAALDASTEYVAQVRLVRRVDGVVTDASPVRSVQFTTVAAPIGAPAPDPGGSGGESVIPFTGTTGGTPSAPSTTNGCWWEWKVQQLAANAYTYTDTALSGTADGDAESIDIDFGSLDPGLIVRVCRREACDTTGNGTADTFGDWECGLPFPAPVDWDVACAGTLDSPGIVGLDVEGDAVFRYPQLCKVPDEPFDRMVMLEAVSGVEIARGPGFNSFFVDATSEAGVLPPSDLTSSPFPPVITAGLTALPTMLVAEADWTIVSRFRALGSFSGSTGRAWSLGSFGGIVSIYVTETATGWVPSALVLSESGVLNLTGSEITFDSGVTHSLGLRWDDDGNLALFVDGSSADTEDVSAVSLYETTTATIAGWHAAPGSIAVMQQMGWDRALTDDEVYQLTGATLERIAVELGAWGYWKRDEPSGDILDYSGNDRHIDSGDAFGSYQGWTAADGNDYFDGVATYGPDDSLRLDGGTPIVSAVWIAGNTATRVGYLNSTPTSLSGFAGSANQDYDCVDDGSFRVDTNDTGRTTHYAKWNFGANETSAGDMMGAVFRRSALPSRYLNGVDIGGNPVNSPGTMSVSSLWFGGGSQLAHLMVFDRELTPTEFANIYAAAVQDGF